MKKALVLLLLALLSGATPALAQEGSLKISVSGVPDAPPSPNDYSQVMHPYGFRVHVHLTNSGMGVMNVTRVSGTFFGEFGKELGKDTAEPLQLRGKESKIADLYFANQNSFIYVHSLTGSVEYTQDGKTFTVPIKYNGSDDNHP